MLIVYSIAEFNMSRAGRFGSYVFFLSHDNSFLSFGNAIGQKALAITSIEQERFHIEIPDVPSHLQSRFSFDSIILVICPRKSEATQFLRVYQQIQRWFKRAYSEIDPTIYAKDTIPSLSSIGDIAVVAIPDGFRKERTHVLDVLARLVETGLAAELLDVAHGIHSLADRIQDLSFCQTTVAGNTVFIDTSSFSRKVMTVRELHENVFHELQQLKTTIASLKQTTETQKVLRELALFRKEHGQYHSPAAFVQASVGFEMLGNGIKLVFDSSGLSTQLIERVRGLFGRLKKGRLSGAGGAEQILFEQEDETDGTVRQ
jgi:hypothetical protein